MIEEDVKQLCDLLPRHDCQKLRYLAGQLVYHSTFGNSLDHRAHQAEV
jgi:hypothetical protein